MKDSSRWVLLLPFLVFGVGIWLYFQTDNEVRVQMNRAAEKWRTGSFEEAVALYEAVPTRYPASRYADDAIWEVGRISYFNFDDLNRAISCFHRITTHYPGTALAKESHLKLAEINEASLKDLPEAIRHWKQALLTDSSVRLRREVTFKIASAYLKLGSFDEAREQFGQLTGDETRDHLCEQAMVRVGAILQIKRDHKEAVGYFQQVLNDTQCVECRVQARLGLIESLEYMDEIPAAIDAVQGFQPGGYPEPLKQDLLRRLREKNRYNQPKLWNGR